MNKNSFERKKFISHSSKITPARWQAKWPVARMEHSLGGAAVRKKLGGAVAEITSGEGGPGSRTTLEEDAQLCFHQGQTFARYESERWDIAMVWMFLSRVVLLSGGSGRLNGEMVFKGKVFR